ncbi:MAG TPA: hypothetical protein VEC14_02660 [Reyranellaceae bacterium]|nr:hypothetical protein [Reyranellaceae bacterium]
MSEQPTGEDTYQLPEQHIYGGEPPPPPATAGPAASAEADPARPGPASPPAPAAIDLLDDEIEPPIERHDPFDYMRGARWMNRKLSYRGRAARRMQEELEAFPVLEGREPNTADIDALAKRVVDYMAPIFKREQLTDMAYDILEERRQARIVEKRRSAAVAATAVASEGLLRPPSAPANPASRAGAVLAGAAARAAGTAAMIVLPTRFDYGTTVPLAEGLRARRLTGQRSIEIERKVDDGLVGTGLGSKWEKLDVAAEYTTGSDGKHILEIDAAQLEHAIGRQAAAQILQQSGVGSRARGIETAIRNRKPGESSPGYLPILEMRITSTVDGGVKVEHREIADADAAKFCPNYVTVLNDALEASAMVRSMGIPNGPTYGRLVHAEVERRLKARGIPNLETERGLLGGAKIGYLRSGSSKIDVVEQLDHDTACIYDVKTGGAEFKNHTRERYLKEVIVYHRVRKVYVLPVHVQ